ncbi:MAG TPA: M67 family metallopeptidase [Candidatus Limnocylindria bacterium]|nr:M67 family metallopeptidase [Candidatus Limnocylindria bacterium]
MRLRPALRDEIVAHARQEAPREACGLLAGRDGGISRVIRCANVHPTPTTRYVIDPREQLKAFRSMDAAGEELVGIYHSHPVSQPYPSPTDRAEAHYPDALYVLVSLRSGTPELRAYRIGADEFIREVPLSA